MATEIIVDQAPQSGADNMRIDAEMLDSAVKIPGRSVARLYQWNAPTISLGHFQKSAKLPRQFVECPVVNRLSGGGAILHDREITYSFAVSAQHSFRHEPMHAYERVHRAIINVLREHGVDCDMRGERHVRPAAMKSDEDFLCYLRHDPRDVVIGSHKIIGSAQRRRKGSILQHGSILLQASELVPEIQGIVDLYPEFSVRKLKDQLPTAVLEAIDE